MQCASHHDTPAVAFCRNCGRAVCQQCRREWLGVPHCEECLEKLSHAPSQQSSAPPAAERPGTAPGPGVSSAAPPPWTAPPPGVAPNGGAVSPVLAAILGFVPGLGGVYNGQYVKGILHVVIWGTLMSINVSETTGDLRGLFIPLLVLFWLYMPIEAYRTARLLERGQPVHEFSGLLVVFQTSRPSPAGGVALIVLGVLFLLHTLGYWRLGDLIRFWPVLLIGLGVYMLYRSVVAQRDRDQQASASFGRPAQGPPHQPPRVAPQSQPSAGAGGAGGTPRQEAEPGDHSAAGDQAGARQGSSAPPADPGPAGS